MLIVCTADCSVQNCQCLCGFFLLACLIVRVCNYMFPYSLAWFRWCFVVIRSTWSCVYQGRRGVNGLLHSNQFMCALIQSKWCRRWTTSRLCKPQVLLPLEVHVTFLCSYWTGGPEINNFNIISARPAQYPITCPPFVFICLALFSFLLFLWKEPHNTQLITAIIGICVVGIQRISWHIFASLWTNNASFTAHYTTLRANITSITPMCWMHICSSFEHSQWKLLPAPEETIAAVWFMPMSHGT